jgi:hypothetical protein
MRRVQTMRLSGTNLARLAVVHAVGLAALALATPANATDDPPPPPVVRATVLGLTSATPDETQSRVAAAVSAVTSLVEQENPANILPPASATTQADTVGQSRSPAISPTNAQESPERASTKESQQRRVPTPPDHLQYHERHVQYQRPSNARVATPRLVLPTTDFSAREPKRITQSSSPIESPNASRNGAWNCSSDPDGSWSPDVPADGGGTLHCTPDPPADEETGDEPPDRVDCDDTGTQYQPDDTQYQPPTETTCDTPDDSVVPIAEPVGVVSSTPASVDGSSVPDVVSPATEPVAPPAAPDTEPTQCGADVLPAVSPHAATARRVAGSRFIGKHSRPRFSSPKQQSRGERELSGERRPVTRSIPTRPRPLQASSTEAKSSISSGKIEATASLLLEPASSRGSVFRGWFVASVTLSFVLALGLLLSAVAITVGRSLRARVGSKGLSDHRVCANRPGGIRYRE